MLRGKLARHVIRLLSRQRSWQLSPGAPVTGRLKGRRGRRVENAGKHAAGSLSCSSSNSSSSVRGRSEAVWRQRVKRRAERKRRRKRRARRRRKLASSSVERGGGGRLLGEGSSSSSSSGGRGCGSRVGGRNGRIALMMRSRTKRSTLTSPVMREAGRAVRRTAMLTWMQRRRAARVIVMRRGGINEAAGGVLIW